MIRTALVVVLAAVGVSAQSSQAPSRTFDVVSVKLGLTPGQMGAAIGRALANGETPPGPSAIPVGIRTYPGGRFTANTSLRDLLVWAYGVKEYQIEGGPKWIAEDFFVVDARVSREATAAEFTEMVQALLTDRFAFRAHSSTRPGKVYNLVLARADQKLGPSLKPTAPECLAQIEEKKRAPAAPQAPGSQPPRNPASGPPDATPRCGTTRLLGNLFGGAVTLSASGEPISKLVERLVTRLGATVVDRTGLEGLFDFVVDYELPPVVVGLPLPRTGLDANGSDAPRLPLPNAIERQLGLKLEAVEGPVPIFVIDAAERPKPN